MSDPNKYAADWEIPSRHVPPAADDPVIELPGGLGSMTSADIYWLGVKHGRAAERERCAKIAEFPATELGLPSGRIAVAIRKGEA